MKILFHGTLNKMFSNSSSYKLLCLLLKHFFLFDNLFFYCIFFSGFINIYPNSVHLSDYIKNTMLHILLQYKLDFFTKNAAAFFFFI